MWSIKILFPSKNARAGTLGIRGRCANPYTAADPLEIKVLLISSVLIFYWYYLPIFRTFYVFFLNYQTLKFEKV